MTHGLCRRIGQALERAVPALWHDVRGLAAIEFAVAAPVMAVALAGALELTVASFVGSLLESSLSDASRYGVTGFTTEEVSREQRVLDIVGARTLGLLDMDAVAIASLIYPSFEDIGQPEPFDDLNANGTRDAIEPFQDINGNGQWDLDMGVAGMGGPGDIVVYSIAYAWPMMTPIIDHIVGEIDLSSSIAVRNEPF